MDPHVTTPAPPAGSPAPESAAPPVAGAPPPPPAGPKPAAASRWEALPHRVLCGLVGVTLVVAFFVPWIQITENSSGRLTGFELAMDGASAGTPHSLLFVVPTLGLALLLTAWWGRRRACVIALTGAGLAIVLGGAWQTLLYVAAAIGPGLWLLAAAGLAALLGGLPWPTILGRRRAGPAGS